MIGFIKPELSFPSYLIGFLKPEKDAYELVKYALKCDYSEIMFVDDKPQNVEAAKELGMHGIVYNKDTIMQDVTEVLAKENSNTILPPQTNRNR
ncbi:MAG: HAD-IA family hydrolase [Elusimicrobiaceae bacterium]|nr:HAD-IA family hydrolase [Elusimicrobiaceae bacterium]